MDYRQTSNQKWIQRGVVIKIFWCCYRELKV